MIWLIGLSAVVLSAGRTRLARPAWVVIGAVILTAGLYQAPANMLIRNLALVVASIDASLAMLTLVRGTAPKSPGEVGGDVAQAPLARPERLGQAG
jgi:hypothetical protein